MLFIAIVPNKNNFIILWILISLVFIFLSSFRVYKLKFTFFVPILEVYFILFRI